MSLQPPFTQAFLQTTGPNKGKPTSAWRDYLLEQQTINSDSAPTDAFYVVTKSNSSLTGEQNLGSLTTGYLRQTVSGGISTLGSALATFTQSSPSDPTGTADATGKMMGLAGTITPTFTGRVWVTITGSIFNPTAIADGAKVQIRTGTGTAPANGDALTGTARGSLVRYVAATVAEIAPFTVTAIVNGLTLNVALWIDVGLAAITGGTATISDLTITALEV